MKKGLLIAVVVLVLLGAVGVIWRSWKASNPTASGSVQPVDMIIATPVEMDAATLAALVDDLQDREKAPAAAQQLAAQGNRAADPLVAALGNLDYCLEKKDDGELIGYLPLNQVIDLLSPYAPPSMVPPLAPLVKHIDPKVRGAAARGLGVAATNDALPHLLRILKDDDPNVLGAALQGIRRGIELGRSTQKYRTDLYEAAAALLPTLEEEPAVEELPLVLLTLDSQKAVVLLQSPDRIRSGDPSYAYSLAALNQKRILVPQEDLLQLATTLRPKAYQDKYGTLYGETMIALAYHESPNVEEMIREAMELDNRDLAERAAKALCIFNGVPDFHDVAFKEYVLVSRNPAFLTNPTRAYVLVSLFKSSMDTGGFAEFFSSTSGGYGKETVEGLREVGASRTADLLDQAIKVFGWRGLSSDPNKRIAQVQGLSEPDWEKLDELDATYREDREHLYIRLLRYVANYKEAFYRPTFRR